MTVRDMVELATDDVFECKVYDLMSDNIIFEGMLGGIPEGIIDMELCSWDTADNGIICFNVEMEQ